MLDISWLSGSWPKVSRPSTGRSQVWLEASGPAPNVTWWRSPNHSPRARGANRRSAALCDSANCQGQHLGKDGGAFSGLGLMSQLLGILDIAKTNICWRVSISPRVVGWCETLGHQSQPPCFGDLEIQYLCAWNFYMWVVHGHFFLILEDVWCVSRREWMGMGVAGTFISKYDGSFPHSRSEVAAILEGVPD